VPLVIAGSAVMIILIALSRVYPGAPLPLGRRRGVLLGLAWVFVALLAVTIRARRRVAP
jgi:hypothetical protein